MYLNTFLNTLIHTPLNINNIEALWIDQLITGSNTSTQSHVASVILFTPKQHCSLSTLMLYFPLEKVHLKPLII